MRTSVEVEMAEWKSRDLGISCPQGQRIVFFFGFETFTPTSCGCPILRSSALFSLRVPQGRHLDIECFERFFIDFRIFFLAM